MREGELFRRACYADDLTKFYENCLKEKLMNTQQFHDATLIHKKYCPSRFCRACGKTILSEEFDYMVGYFVKVWYPVHKKCGGGQVEYEHVECQKLDMNCNDCGFLERDLSRRDGDVLYGHCVSKSVGVSFLPKVCMPENKGCFKHRKIRG